MKFDSNVISPSGLAKILECPRKAHESESVNDMQAFPIGMHVGNLVHAYITGHKYEKPDKLLMDKVTPTMRDAEIQANAMIEAALGFLDDYDSIDQELHVSRELYLGGEQWRVEGSIDLVLEKDGKRYICDLKTGYRRPRGVWPQLAAYAFALGENGAVRGAVLWVPRQRYRLSDTEPEWEDRDYNELWRAGMELAIAAVRATTYHMTATPSQIACASCTVEDCAVRWW